VVLGTGLNGSGKPANTGVRTPVNAAPNKSLYGLLYPDNLQ